MLNVWHTSIGRKFALLEGLSHDLVCAGSNYHVHFTWQVWHGQYSPGFRFNKLKSFSPGEIDRNHVDLKDSRGKGFALLNKHRFCPASALRHRCCIDIKRCSCGYTHVTFMWNLRQEFGEVWAPRKTQKSYCVTAQVLHWHHALFMWIYSVPVYVEFEAKIWRGLDTKKTQKAHFNRKKFALLEGLSHDLVCAWSNYHVHFTWQVWHGQYSPGFEFNSLKSFSPGGNWPESCWLKGF